MVKLVALTGLLALAGCNSTDAPRRSSKSVDRGAEVPDVPEAQKLPPPPTHWSNLLGESILDLDDGRKLTVRIDAARVAGRDIARLEVSGKRMAGATIAIVGTDARVRLAADHGSAYLPLALSIGALPLAEIIAEEPLGAASARDLNVTLEVALVGRKAVQARLPHMNLRPLLSSLFKQPGGIVLEGEASGASQRDTLLHFGPLANIAVYGAGKTVGDVDLVAVETVRPAGTTRCPGHELQLDIKPSTIVVHDRRTGAEVARRTFEPICPDAKRPRSWVRGMAADESEVRTWLATFAGPAQHPAAGEPPVPEVPREARRAR